MLTPAYCALSPSLPLMSIVDSAGDSTWAELPHELQHIITCCLDVQGLCQFAGCSRYSERLVQVATDRWSQHFLELYPGLLCILGSKANNRKWGSILGELNWRELHRAVRLRRTFQAQARADTRMRRRCVH